MLCIASKCLLNVAVGSTQIELRIVLSFSINGFTGLIANTGTLHHPFTEQFSISGL